jgi:hypothetical protein
MVGETKYGTCKQMAFNSIEIIIIITRNMNKLTYSKFMLIKTTNVSAAQQMYLHSALNIQNKNYETKQLTCKLVSKVELLTICVVCCMSM